MAEKLAKWFVGIFGGITGTLFGKYLVIFIISMIPILELRGGLIAASLLELPMWTSYLICFIGNVIPIPFILWLINPMFRWMSKKKKLGKIVKWCENKANSKKEQIERLEYIGLYLFVAIPLPGTGAWTGCLIAALLNLNKKKSLIAAILGVITAGLIMLLVSYGIIGKVF